MSTEYAIGVKFRQESGWSKTYAYKSEVPLTKDTIVLVNKGDFYTVGKVVGCKSNYEFDPKLHYKFILMPIELENNNETTKSWPGYSNTG